MSITTSTDIPRVAWSSEEVALMSKLSVRTVRKAAYENKLKQSSVKDRYTMAAIMAWLGDREEAK